MAPTNFRIVLPVSYKGMKHTARDAKLFMEVEGRVPIELSAMLPVRSVHADWHVDNVTEIQITLAGSVEVVYE